MLTAIRGMRMAAAVAATSAVIAGGTVLGPVAPAQGAVRTPGVVRAQRAVRAQHTVQTQRTVQPTVRAQRTVPAGDAVPVQDTVPVQGAVPARGSVPQQGLASQVRAAEQAQLQAMNVTAAWKMSKGRGVKVGVLDTGVDAGVPDLSGSVTTGPDFTRGADPSGYHPPHLHGTFIASLIAGHGSGPGRAEGVVGIAPEAKVLSVRVILDDQEPGFAVYNENSAFDNAIGRGIKYAVNHGVTVINMSLGSPSQSRDTRAAIGYAVSHGVVVVAAAGNSGHAGNRFAPYSYPASYTGVISVAALTAHGTRASFSQRNSSVVISAPGVGIVGAGPGGSYLQAEGTSPASAFVAGVAALIRSRYPALPPAMVAEALITSTRHRPRAGYDPGTGFGEVNAAAALRAARALAAARPSTGMATSGFFGQGPRGPIEVVHRDKGAIAAEGSLGAAAALGFAASLVCLGVLMRRRRRDRLGSGGPPLAVTGAQYGVIWGQYGAGGQYGATGQYGVGGQYGAGSDSGNDPSAQDDTGL